MADIIGNIYLPNNENKLIYLINGKPVMNPVNELVKSTDRLLVWYGTGTEEELMKKVKNSLLSSCLKTTKKTGKSVKKS